TILVTTTADEQTPNDGGVSLREAIAAINAGNNLNDPDITAQNFGTNDTINFRAADFPPGKFTSIVLDANLGPLPTIVRKVRVDAFQDRLLPPPALPVDNEPTVVLDGTNAGAGASGLWLSANGCVVLGLDIINFSANGIFAESSENFVAGNW